MAIYCGVCAAYLYGASENCGSFPVANGFNGWNTYHSSGGTTLTPAIINDTCRSCANILAQAITNAANKIVADNLPSVIALRNKLQADRDASEKQYKDKEEFRVEFEKAWAQRTGK